MVNLNRSCANWRRLSLKKLRDESRCSRAFNRTINWRSHWISEMPHMKNISHERVKCEAARVNEKRSKKTFSRTAPTQSTAPCRYTSNDYQFLRPINRFSVGPRLDNSFSLFVSGQTLIKRKFEFVSGRFANVKVLYIIIATHWAVKCLARRFN